MRGTLIDPTKNEHDAYDYGDRVSKSQRKRDSTAVQDLGAQLVELSKEKILSLGLPEKVEEALIACQKITAHGGRRRQLQYIGKVMRDIDAEPIRLALEKLAGNSKREISDMHLAERWRERMLKDADAVALFANEFAGTDLQQLRTALRNALKEQAQNKPPRDFRKLYQLVKEQLDARRDAEAAGLKDAPTNDLGDTVEDGLK